MNAEQILAQLHDLQLPTGGDSADSAAFVFWPLLLVLGAGAIMAWLSWRRRTWWRRQAIAALVSIDRQAQAADHGRRHDLQRAWQQLATLMRQLALLAGNGQTLPVERLTGEDWLAHLDTLVGRPVFTEGPGRGLLTYPYRQLASDGEGELSELVRQLRRDTGWLRRIQPGARGTTA